MPLIWAHVCDLYSDGNHSRHLCARSLSLSLSFSIRECGHHRPHLHRPYSVPITCASHIPSLGPGQSVRGECRLLVIYIWGTSYATPTHLDIGQQVTTHHWTKRSIKEDDIWPDTPEQQQQPIWGSSLSRVRAGRTSAHLADRRGPTAAEEADRRRLERHPRSI